MSDRVKAAEALAADPGRSGLVLELQRGAGADRGRPHHQRASGPGCQQPGAAGRADGAGGDYLGTAGGVSGRAGRPARGAAARVVRDGAVHRRRPADRSGSREVAESGPCGRRTLREELAGLAGIRVEEKSVSVAVHWRQAPDHAAAAQDVRAGHGAHRRRSGAAAGAGKAGGGAAAADRRGQGIGDLDPGRPRTGTCRCSPTRATTSGTFRRCGPARDALRIRPRHRPRPGNRSAPARTGRRDLPRDRGVRRLAGKLADKVVGV